MPQLLQETLDTLLETIETSAARAFARRGFSACTTRQLAGDLGLTAGSLYVHYKGKEDLFARAVNRYQEWMRSDANPLVGVLRETRFPFDIPRLAAAIRDLVTRHSDYWILWYVDVIEFGGRHFKPMLAPRAPLEIPELSARLADLRHQDLLRIDPEVAFQMTYMHLFNYFLIETLFGGERHYGLGEDEAIAAMEATLLGGMLSPKGRRAHRRDGGTL